MIVLFKGQQLVLRQIAESGSVAHYRLPNLAECAGLELEDSRLMVAGITRLAHLCETPPATHPLQLVNLRQAFELLPEQLVPQLVYANQLLHYERTNRFCASCGLPTTVNQLIQRLHCSRCQQDIYPRIAPAMIVAVSKGDQLLMAQAHHFAPSMWSLLAGFVEVGESLEQTVAREVFEEVGLQVKNIRYWGSQYWPFPNSLMVGFSAEYASGEIVLQANEMRAAGFYTKDQLPGRPSSKFSIAQRMIEAFIAAN